MAPPSLGGTPDRVGLADWLLVEWVASAKRGDPFPEPWCQAHDPPRTMVQRLAELGVMAAPPAGADDSTVAREASAAAARWIEVHPRPDPAAQDAPRHLSFGLAPDLAPDALDPGDDPEEPAAVRMRRLVLERLRQAGGPGRTDGS